MARVTVEDCLDTVPNRFALVHLASKRTKMLLKGARSMVDAPENKDAVVALREIADQKVRLPDGWHIVDVDRPPEEELPPDQRED